MEISMAVKSILNDIIGPIMHGSSAGHTAGPYQIARMCRRLMGAKPEKVAFLFHEDSGLATSYREHSTDLALLCGILDVSLVSPDFIRARELASESGLDFSFNVEAYPEAEHPNSLKILAEYPDGICFSLVADSIGGGAILIRRINDWEIVCSGDQYHLFVESEDEHAVTDVPGEKSRVIYRKDSVSSVLVAINTIEPIAYASIEKIKGSPGVVSVWYAEPVCFPVQGVPLFTSANEMICLAEKRGVSLGELALAYEASLLGLPEKTLNEEMEARLDVMLASVQLGLSDACPEMFMLKPTAQKVWLSEQTEKLLTGGIHTRAAARALAAMQVNSGQGVVCAAPTGGSAGIMPGVFVTMLEDMKFSKEQVVRGMWAAGAIGIILAMRASLSGAYAGCQVEVGGAGAMSAAGLVEIAGGTPKQAADAAALVFHNVTGLVCDMVGNVVEIPCHTRNASLASQAFLCADLILGGYINYIALDDTIDAVYAVGRGLPPELRATSAGGIAATPSASKIKRIR